MSSLSDRSDTSEQGVGGEVSGEESPGILSDDQPPESPSDSNDTDDTAKNMPWMKVIIYIITLNIIRKKKIMLKRKVPKYGLHKNRNLKGKLLLPDDKKYVNKKERLLSVDR